ncbi:Uncharacterised protein [Mycobacteroides abscessus subsp. abscessus]|nr:Uncharacterised protein [Mycobacteroides abscessus subsp. abscessus]
MGPGQRTMAVPMRRHTRVLIARLGSKKPKKLATVSTAGASVSAAATAVSMPTTPGMPML